MINSFNNKSVKIPERVHIAPIGFEIDRVVLPFLEMKGDGVRDTRLAANRCIRASCGRGGGSKGQDYNIDRLVFFLPTTPVR